MKKIISNYMYNALYQILLIALPFLTTPYLSRVLGPSQLGRYGVVLSVSQFMVVFITMGLGQLGVRTIAEKNSDNLNDRFWNLFLIQFCAGVIVSAVYLCLTQTLFKDSSVIYIAQFPFILAYVFDISWLFQGLEMFKKVVVRNSAVKLLSVALIFLFVKQENDLVLYIVINSMSFLVSNVVFWLGLKGKVTKFTYKKDLFLPYLRQSIYLLIPQILTQVIITLDKPILSFFSDSTQVAYYDQSQKLSRMILSLITTLNIVMLPSLSQLASKDNRNLLRDKISKSFKFSYLLGGFLAVSVFNFSDIFVPWFFDSSFEPMVTNLKIVSFLILVIPIGLVFSNQYALAIKDDRAYLLPLVIGAASAVIIYPLLMSKFTSVGGSISILLVESIICGSRMFFVRKDFSYRKIFMESLHISLLFLSLAIVGSIVNLLVVKFALGIVFHWIILIVLHLIVGLYILKELIKSFERNGEIHEAVK